VTRYELEHAIRAACDVAHDDELYVFGSQAILGQWPDALEALRVSAEVDVMPKNRPERVDDIDGALGELSSFHLAHGFYVHGLHIDAAKLPKGWQERLVMVRNDNTNQCTGWCIEASDLAVSKLAAFREKDRAFVRVLMSEGIVDAPTLLERIDSLDITPDHQERLRRWVAVLGEELD
jgi:hypothetical protein